MGCSRLPHLKPGQRLVERRVAQKLAKLQDCDLLAVVFALTAEGDPNRRLDSGPVYELWVGGGILHPFPALELQRLNEIIDATRPLVVKVLVPEMSRKALLQHAGASVGVGRKLRGLYERLQVNIDFSVQGLELRLDFQDVVALSEQAAAPRYCRAIGVRSLLFYENRRVRLALRGGDSGLVSRLVP